MNPRPLSEDVTNLTRRTAEANAALVRGDIDGYLALIEHAKDYTLMAPFGGTPTRGFDTSSRARIAQFFKSGTFDQEVVATYATDDLIVLVTIERVRAEVGALPEQDWSLRVTQVFRREGTEWRLVHRHADPLVNGINLEQAAALAKYSIDGVIGKNSLLCTEQRHLEPRSRCTCRPSSPTACSGASCTTALAS